MSCARRSPACARTSTRWRATRSCRWPSGARWWPTRRPSRSASSTCSTACRRWPAARRPRLPREDVELGDLVDAALFAARRRHTQVVFELEDRINGDAVHGWPGGLRLVVDNLLDNAALHGRAHGRVWVGLHRDGGELLLSVEDDGDGIPAAQRQALLEPFARGAEASAEGTGLGLAIVAQQVALHGGDLVLADATLGGLAVRVWLPRVEA